MSSWRRASAAKRGGISPERIYPLRNRREFGTFGRMVDESFALGCAFTMRYLSLISRTSAKVSRYVHRKIIPGTRLLECSAPAILLGTPPFCLIRRVLTPRVGHRRTSRIRLQDKPLRWHRATADPRIRGHTPLVIFRDFARALAGTSPAAPSPGDFRCPPALGCLIAGDCRTRCPSPPSSGYGRTYTCFEDSSTRNRRREPAR
jgi:hypothetical protein